MRKRRAADRELGELPAVADPKRRKRLEKDHEAWLQYYLPHKFFRPFANYQQEMIRDTMQIANYGGDQADAAPRGGGKTSIVEGCALLCLLTGCLRFVLAIGATGEAGQQILDSVKHELETNERLAADYPEVCYPIWQLEGEPRRARTQTIDGRPTRIKWLKKMIVLPTVEGSRASGGIFACRGLHAAVRGLKHVVDRPDFVIIDDPETYDSARNPRQVRKRMDRINMDIAGLAGPGKTIARMALVTISAAGCLADQLTDPAVCPTFNGKRFRMVVSWPARMDLVEEYITLYKACHRSGDREGKKATEFYVTHRSEIDDGFVCSDPNRQITKIGSDGASLELSSQQHAMNWVARMNGWDAFNTECQNEPPRDSLPETMGLTADLVVSRINDYDRFAFPSEAICITASIDLNMPRSHYETVSWLPNQAGLTIDKDRFDIIGVGKGEENKEAIKRAIINALLDWRSKHVLDPICWNTRGGELVPPNLVMVDAGNWQDAVYDFVKLVGGLPFVPSKGFGSGPRSAPYSAGKANKERIVGNHWWISYQREHDIWLYGYDADYWKHRVHQGFLTPTFHDDRTIRELSRSLWKPEHKQEHYWYAQQIVAEEWREQFVEGKGWIKGWVPLRRDNHGLDTAVMSAVAHDVWRTRMLHQSPPASAQRPLDTEGQRARLTTPSGLPYLITER